MREQRRKKPDQKREKTEKKEDRKKTKKISALEASAKRKQEETSFSLYLYAHIIKNRECT